MIWAAAHPGKIGDALYTLPMLNYLARKHNVTFDFYTSAYCAPLTRLMEFQDSIHTCIVAQDYRVERMDMGCQPAEVPIPAGYKHVYQCGFKRVPDRMLHQFIAAEHGIYEPLAVEYQFPDASVALPAALRDARGQYICIAPRASSSYDYLFDALPDHYTCVVIGGPNDYRGRGIDMTGLDMLDTLTVLSQARGFVGLMSSQLVLANGFPYPKIVPHDNRSWDMRHVINQSSNTYLVNPSVQDVVRHL